MGDDRLGDLATLSIKGTNNEIEIDEIVYLTGQGIAGLALVE